MQQRIDDIVSGILEKMKVYGLSESTINLYNRGFCKRITRYCDKNGDGKYSKSLLDSFLDGARNQLNEDKIKLHHFRTTERIIRYLKDYAETGDVNFTKVVNTRKYNPIKEHLDLIDRMLEETNLHDEFKYKIHCCMRHFFCFVESLGITTCKISDDIIRSFILESKKTNAGSMEYIIYSVNLIAEYFNKNEIADIQADYHCFMPKSVPIRLIMPYTQEEINRILQAINPKKITAKRDRAIILLAFNTGLRGIDIVNLQHSDIDWNNGNIRIVQHKTKKPVTLPICGTVMNALADYILEERPACNDKIIFLRSFSPHLPLKGTSALDNVIDTLCQKAGIEKRYRRSFHSLRRSFATELSAFEIPLTSISQMLGHQSIDSDQPYLSFNRKQTSLCAIGFDEIPIINGIYAGKLNFKRSSKNTYISEKDSKLYELIIIGFAEIPLNGGVYAC